MYIYTHVKLYVLISSYIVSGLQQQHQLPGEFSWDFKQDLPEQMQRGFGPRLAVAGAPRHPHGFFHVFSQVKYDASVFVP